MAETRVGAVGRGVRAVGLWVIFAGRLIAAGQQTATVDGSAGATTGSLTGVVELGDTRAPAAGAIVFLTMPPAPAPKIVDGEYIVRDEPPRGAVHATADPTGRVAMREVRPGEYRVVAQVEGYVSPEEYIAPWGLAPVDAAGRAELPAFVQTVRVEAGKETHFVLRLERGGAVEGRVQYADGRPAFHGGSVVPGVAVNLLVRKPEGGFGHCVMCTVHTDENGHYRIGGLPAATYVVEVAIGGEMVPTARGEEGTQGLVMYAGGTQRLGRAETVEVRGREVVREDVVLPLTGLHRVSGRVIAPDGTPPVEGRLRLAPKGETDRYDGPLLNSIVTPIERDGSFHFESVMPDTYTLSLEEERDAAMVGLTTDGKGVKMRIVPARYAPASETVTVGGSDPAAVVLRVVAAR